MVMTYMLNNLPFWVRIGWPDVLDPLTLKALVVVAILDSMNI